LGRKCVECGFDDARALEFDHIDNDGDIERKKYGGYKSMVAAYANNPELAKAKIQVMCANCNRVKRYNHFIAKGTWLVDYYGGEK